MDSFDLIVVGSGPGGYVAAERAGALGKKVLIIEKEHLGGVCTNRGCIPTKSLLNSAKLYTHAQDGKQFGVQAQGVSFSLLDAMAWKEETIKTLRSGIEFLMKSNKVQTVFGEARFLDAHHVQVGETVYEGSYLIIVPDHRNRKFSLRSPDSRIQAEPCVDQRRDFGDQGNSCFAGGDRRRSHRYRIRLLLLHDRNQGHRHRDDE